ncbi:MAG: alpha/beta hydrolase [Candidatus Pacebacteria bacterium]|nr:alpha/beta hydrolase [Candidatus Paceibacterota bacterium]
MWTMFINPETDEVVEGKVYMPKGQVKKVLIICPGYRGDFVLQERHYAHDFCRSGRAVICLRHNSLRTVGKDVENYVHCPQRQVTGGRYTGEGAFSVKKANREVLTVLKALEPVGDIEEIDILAHSWGGQISLESLKAIKESGEMGAVKKLKNLVLLGATLDSRPETYLAYREAFVSDAKQDFFNCMDPDQIIEDFLDNAEDMGNFSSADIPENVRIVIINSSADQEIDVENEQIPFHGKIQDCYESTWIFLRVDPIEIALGGRSSEGHDYIDSQIWEVIQDIIK